jgi:hypothetical protein
LLVRNEPPPLLFIGQSTSARSETPQGWPQDQWTSATWKPRINRPKVGSANPIGLTDPRWAPLVVCFLRVAVLWALKSVPGVHVFLRRFRRSDGSMDPCEVHVSCSDLSGFASLGLVTWCASVVPEVAWLACMAPKVATIP